MLIQCRYFACQQGRNTLIECSTMIAPLYTDFDVKKVSGVFSTNRPDNFSVGHHGSKN